MSDTARLDPEIAAILERYEATLMEWIRAARDLIDALDDTGRAIVAAAQGED
jgi:hypothetical protein